jgi:hypothetical protein
MDKSLCLSRTDAYYLECIDKAVLSEKTKSIYKFSIQRIQRIIPNKSICDIMLSPNESFNALKNAISNPTSLQTTCASLLAIFKHAGIKQDKPSAWQAWYDHFHPLSSQITKQRESNIPTENQEKALVDWNNVLKYLDKLSKTSYGSRNHLLLAIYTLIPPRRQEDYYSIYIYQDATDNTPKDKHHAYIDITLLKPLIHVRDFKTAAALRPWTKELPPRLVSIIKKSLLVNPRVYLFTQKNGDPYTTANSFTKANNRALVSMFGIHVTLNSLRHSFSTKLKQTNDLSVGEHKQIARDMGHSQATNMTYAFITPTKK